jgi:anionic cell wall polymer biosynthesis LytR-Cps2A-Psr (LCP) family protein
LALKYARTRHVDNDFGRAARQQQVLLAVRQKALSLGVPYMLSQAPTLFNQLERGIRTDLTLDQILQIGRTASRHPIGKYPQCGAGHQLRAQSHHGTGRASADFAQQ